MKLKRNDEVKIVKGKDKGKTGKIEKIFPASNKVLVPDINTYKRHVKARMQNQKSEIITLTKPLPVSNVALICPKCKQQSRVGYLIKNKKKERICRKCGATLWTKHK